MYICFIFMSKLIPSYRNCIYSKNPKDTMQELITEMRIVSKMKITSNWRTCFMDVSPGMIRLFSTLFEI